MEFKEKVVIITGAGSGIGKVTAEHFGKEGATVVVSDINEENGNQVLAQVKALGGAGIFVKTNVAKFEEVEQLINQTVEQFGKIDFAVNNAGISNLPTHKTGEHALEDWDKIIAVNQTGVFYCMRQELQQMHKQGHGAIVNIASMAGLKALTNQSAYVASKHAVIGMTKTAAVEYAKLNIRVNALCPAFTFSNLFKPEYFGEKSEALKRAVPMRRFAEPEEMASKILWLCSEQSSYITGLALAVDGGLSA